MTGSIAQISRSDIGGVPIFHAPQPPSSPFLAQLVFRVGMSDETLPFRGITHLVEHLALPVGPAPPVEFNAVVTASLTHFWFSGPRDPVLRLLEGTLASLAVPPVGRLERERDLLSTEAETHTPGPLGGALALRFGARSHGLPGFDELGLPRLSENDVRRWAAERFNRGNVAIAFSGAPPSELEISLPDGEHLEPQAPDPIEELKTPAVFSFSHSGGVWITLICERSMSLSAAMWTLHRRLGQRLRGRRTLSYDPSLEFENLTRREVHVFVHADCLAENQDAVLATLVATLDELASTGPTVHDLEAFVEERERDDANDSYLAGALFWHAGQAALGADFVSPADLIAEARAVTPAQSADALRSAMPTLLLGIAPDATVPGGRFARYPIDSARRVEGRRFRRRGLPTRARKVGERDLIVGEKGVTLVGEDYMRTVHFDEIAAALYFEDKFIDLYGLDGHEIVVDPAIWRRSRELTDMLEQAIPKELVVDLREGGSIFTDDDLVAAEKAYDDGDWARAVTLSTAGLAREPLSQQGWSLLAAAHLHLRNRTAAAESARRAIELAPDDTFSRSTLAQALVESGRGDEALEHTRALLELEPGELETMEAAVFQLIPAGFEQEALEVAERAVELFPNRFEAHNARGWAAQALGEFAEAQASLERGVALEPVAIAHNNLGWVFLKMGKADIALARFDRALELDPNNTYAAANRPLALQLLGRREDAAQAWRIQHTTWLERHEQALEVDPQDADALCSRSQRLWSLGREHEALDAAREAAQRVSDDPVLRRSLATIELASGNRREAATTADVALKLDGASFDALEFAAWYGASAGSELERGATAAKEALAQRPDGTRAWVAAGHGEIAKGRYAEGVAWFDKVIGRWPLACCAAAGRGLALFMNGDHTQAEHDLSRALLLSNDRCTDGLLLKSRLAAAAV